MINKAIRQKDIARLRVFLEPIDQWIVPILYFAPAGVVNRKEINDPTRDDQEEESSRNEFPGSCGEIPRELAKSRSCRR